MLLPLSRDRLSFVAKTRGRFPDFAGSAWRGAFGHALRQTVCTTHLPSCPPCARYRDCLYPMIFETPPDPAGERLLGRNEGVPNPFVLAPGWTGTRVLQPGDEVGLEVTLVGRAMAEAELVFTSLAAAALQGIGPDRVPLTLLERRPLPIDATSPMPPRILLTFTTPLRLVEKGVLIKASSFRPHHLLGALVRRISLLAQYHHSAAPELDFQELKHRAAAAAFAGTDLGWQDWSRHSARQRAVIKMGGLVGTAVLPMAELEPFWPLLRLAPALHVGKGTTMGLGAMTIAPA
ncbi:MAG: CRISPR system precrRNA processing endoribonuclease RAMP protein Cas6 [Acetobacteraceae bacterium]